jgi:isoquinoline 1-oxidoreductase beta subunit
MNAIVNVSRRDFLKSGVLAGGGLILGVYLPRSGQAQDAAGKKATIFAPNAFVRVGSDDTVTVMVNHSEMGQGPYTSIPMIVNEELEADWSKVRPEAAPVDPAYNHAIYGIQMTGGSTSTWSEFDRLRKAGASARFMLIAAAANEWKVDAATCRTQNGRVIHPPSERTLSYGQLVDKAAELTPPQDVVLKDTKDFKVIGKPTKRLDTPEKTNGKAVFGLDVSFPGMLVALVARAPVFGGKVRDFGATKAKSVQGVRDVIKIERGVAVVADGFWAAKKGRDALEVTWEDSPLAPLDSKTQRARYAELAGKPGVIARKDGDATAVLARANKRFEAVFELPYLAHAMMEPLNCLADVRADGCDVWTGTQFQTVDRDAAAAVAGLKPEQVKIHTTLLGGGFGRRAVPDSHFVCEAVEISKTVKKPVKVIWTREDDIQGGYYRPEAVHAISASLDENGNPVAWRQRVVCQSFIAGTPFEPFIIKDGVDDTAVEGARDLPYEIPNVSIEWHQTPSGVPTLWWRSVGHSHSAFAVESFVDELAFATGRNPLDFRRRLLTRQPRHLRLLELIAEKANWNQVPPAGRGRGMAVHASFGSIIAQIAEVSLSRKGEVRVHKVVCAVDCGPVVNPDIVRAQMESGIVFGLTAALYGEITFENGRVKQRNFHDYPMLRMNEMPSVEVHIVPSTEKMGGVGEPGVPPIAPAIANAIFAATGKRVRRLPIRTVDLKRT